MEIAQAHRVEKLPGKVTVERCKFDKVDTGNGKMRSRIVREKVEADAGWMVYLPSGNSFRVATKERLAELGIDPNEAPLINMADGSTVNVRNRTR